ncbi:alpha-2-macroglobulin family protein [Campylobacter sp. MOP51]|uniref:alpha-2-macroglobulin family protein n=1 Tax=Campylobacter canis TaxID=3378588 RepID=UPI003C5CBB58
MLLRSLLAILLLAFNLNAFILTGELKNADSESIMLGISKDKPFKKSQIGTITHKKLLECTPELDAVYEYAQDYLIVYPKNGFRKGVDYTCKNSESSINFYGGNFILDSLFIFSSKDFSVNFNDKLTEEEFVKNVKIYNKDNLSKHDVKYKITKNGDKSFVIKILEEPKNLEFFISKNLKNIAGGNLDDDYIISANQDSSEPNFVDNPKARTLILDMLEAKSLEGGKLAARLYLKDWISTYDNNIKKFIKIQGVESFQVSETYYTSDSMANEGYYYFIDITSDEFKPQTKYQISFNEGFGDDYALVRERVDFDIKFGDLNPFLKFSDNMLYISNIGEIGIESVNTPTAKVVVEKLKEQNYRYFLNFNSSNLNSYVEEVASKNYELGGVKNEILKHKIKLDFPNSGDGVYLITIYYDKDKKAQKAVYLSDIGLNVKVSNDEVFLFASRLSQNAVVANADVKIYSVKNDVIASGITNDEGVFKFNKKDIGKDIASATVSLGKEQGFIILAQNEKLNSNGYFQTGDRAEKYDAYVHFASNIIRPEENIKGEIIIKNELFKALAKMPVKIKIKDPQNKIILNKNFQTNELGVINFDEFINSALTGSFRFEIIFANKIIGEYNFSVESFTPQRIKNSIALKKKIYGIDEIIQADLQSNYLFGSPASNLQGNVSLQLYQTEYKNDKFKDFKFSNDELKNNSLNQIEKPVTLDSNGKASKIFKISDLRPEYTASIVGGAIVFSINDDGKNVSSSENLTIYPFKSMVGIKADKDYVDTNKNVNFSFISIDPFTSEEIKDTPKAIEIKRKIWSYNFDSQGVLRWNSSYELVENLSQDTNNFTYNFTQSGDYEVIISDVSSGHSASVRIDVSGWDYSSLQPTKELAKAQIKLNQKSYKKGDVMSVDVSSVLKNALGIITLESDGVKKYKVVNIQNNSANAKFELDFDFEGLYVSATIVRVADNDLLPFRTYDKVYAKADKSHRMLNVSVNAPKTVRSNSKFKTNVKTDPNAEVTLFAVDEGVLQVTNQKLKSPLEFFDKMLADFVLDFDIYSNLTGFKKEGKVLSFGGDGAMALMEMRMAKFASPVDKKNIKTYIKMQTAKADANGDVSFDVEVPSDFNSQINLAVIAVTENKLGSSVKAVDVKDDIILKPTQSAYFIKGDNINYILRVINTTNEAKELNLTLETNLKAKLEKDKISLKPNENLKMVVALDVNETGKSYLKFSANDGKETYSHKLNFDAIHPYPLSTFAKSFQASEQKTITLDNDFKSIRIDASNSIKSMLGANSDKLINYPYGCSEQRSSRLLELNYMVLTNKDKSKAQAKADEADVKRFLNAGLNDLIKMQKSDGSFGYWSELSYTNNFASIYAIDTILTLEKSGFEIDKAVKSRAIKWLENFGSNDNFQALYAAYILSGQKKLDRSVLNALYDQKRYTNSALDGYLMAAILKNEGLSKESSKVLKEISKTFYDKESDLPDNFGSRIRNTAFMLLIHANHFEKNAFSDEMADYLIKQVEKLYSTQERAFTLRALREYIKDTSSENKFKLISDGHELKFDGLGAINITPIKPEITIVPEKGSSVYLGVTSYAYKPLEINHKFDKKGLDITRKFVGKDGKEIDINNLKLNDVIYSKLMIKTDDYIRNGVINEQVSPCFEIINENIAPNLRTKATTNTLNVEHNVIADDRVLTFYSLSSGYVNVKDKTPFTLYTPLRVVMSGKCMLPAVITENMYDESMSDYDLAQKEFIVK